MSESEETPQNLASWISAKDPVCGMAVDPAGPRQGAARGSDLLLLLARMHAQVHVVAREIPGSRGKAGPQAAGSAAAERQKLGRDPVCGMNVDPAKAAAIAEYERKLYHFCSRGCAEKFKHDPEKYLSPAYKPGGMRGMVQIGGAQRPCKSRLASCEGSGCGMNVDRPRPLPPSHIEQDLLLLLHRLR